MKKLKNQKAFTLLETLASVAILSLVVVGPLAVMINSSSYAHQVQDSMTARFLAEEAIELLQNKADSLYIFCRKNPIDVDCLSDGNQTQAEVAWQKFKEQIGTTTVPIGGEVASTSCYINNDSGCSFDFVGMTQNPTTSIQLFSGNIGTSATSTSCATLTGLNISTSSGTGQAYICAPNATSTGAATSSGDLVKIETAFKRVIKAEQTATYEGNKPVNKQKNDDLRADAKVTYKGKNGKEYKETVSSYIWKRH